MLLLLLYTYDFYGLIDVRIFRRWHQDVNRSRCPRLKKNCKESLLPRLLSMLHRREDPAGVAPMAMATRIPLMVTLSLYDVPWSNRIPVTIANTVPMLKRMCRVHLQAVSGL